MEGDPKRQWEGETQRSSDAFDTLIGRAFTDVEFRQRLTGSEEDQRAALEELGVSDVDRAVGELQNSIKALTSLEQTLGAGRVRFVS